jgi:hypothetical protein
MKGEKNILDEVTVSEFYRCSFKEQHLNFFKPSFDDRMVLATFEPTNSKIPSKFALFNDRYECLLQDER